MAVKIIYRDGANWIPLSGINIEYFGDTRELNQNTRVIPHLLAPEVIIDQWNGEDIKVQEKRYDVYTVQFAAKEDQLNEISKIKSCDSINIVDISNNIDHIADNSTGDSFQISEPEKILNTTNYIIKITYRVNKTIIDKVGIRSDVVTLQGSNTYYSKFDKITYISTNTNIEIPWFDGTTKTLRETKENGYNVLLYLNDGELSVFLEDYGQNNFTIDSVPVIKKINPEISSIGHDLNRVVINLVTDVVRNTDLNITKSLQANNVKIDTSNNYYTDYYIDVAYEDTEQTFADNESGYGILTHTILRYVNTVKFWMTDVELADFKSKFEVSQNITLNKIDVIENRLVKSTKLDTDINEVTAVCLISTDINYPQQ